jgi:hypothetical protein
LARVPPAELLVVTQERAPLVAVTVAPTYTPPPGPVMVPRMPPSWVSRVTLTLGGAPLALRLIGTVSDA